MPADCTWRDGQKLVKVVDNLEQRLPQRHHHGVLRVSNLARERGQRAHLVAAGPPLLPLVEDGRPGVEAAGGVGVFSLRELQARSNRSDSLCSTLAWLRRTLFPQPLFRQVCTVSGSTGGLGACDAHVTNSEFGCGLLRPHRLRLRLRGARAANSTVAHRRLRRRRRRHRRGRSLRVVGAKEAPAAATAVGAAWRVHRARRIQLHGQRRWRSAARVGARRRLGRFLLRVLADSAPAETGQQPHRGRREQSGGARGRCMPKQRAVRNTQANAPERYHCCQVRCDTRGARGRTQAAT